MAKRRDKVCPGTFCISRFRAGIRFGVGIKFASFMKSAFIMKVIYEQNKLSQCIHCNRLKDLKFKDLPFDEEQVKENVALRRKNERFLTVILEGPDYTGIKGFKEVIRNLILKGPRTQYQSPQVKCV